MNRVRLDPAMVSIWLLVASTVVLIPGGFTRFVFPKLLVATFAIGFGAAAHRTGRLPRPIVLVVGAGALVLIVSAFSSGTPLASLIGRWPRYEGVLTLGVYLGCVWLGARLLGGDRTESRREALLHAIAAMSLVLAFASVLDAAGHSVLGPADVERSGAFLGNATDQGIVAMLAVAMLVRPAITARHPLILAGLVGALLTVPLSGSRAAIASTVLVLIVHALVGRGALARQVGLGLVALAALVLALPQARERLLNTHTVTGRSLLWQESWNLGLDHWWLGVGPSRFVDAIGRYHDDVWVDRVGVADPPDSPHSWPLQALVAGGVPLLLLALGLAGLVLTFGWRAVRRAPASDTFAVGAFAATIGYGTALLTHFTAAGTTCLAALLVGALIARPRRAPDDGEHRLVKPIGLSLAGVAIVVLAAGTAAEIPLRTGIDAAAGGDIDQADDDFTLASRLRLGDSDVAMLAAESLAGATSAGVPHAAPLAERWARRSLDHTPASYDSGIALAVALVGQNELRTAADVLDALADRFPAAPDVFIQRGIARFGQRNVDGARSDLRRAIDLDPDDETAPRILTAIDDRLGREDGSSTADR